MEVTMPRYLTKLLVAFAAMFMLHASPAAAQATRTWVSGVGDDVNPCSRTAPCKTFAGAISKTAASGEINCLDAGGFGGVTITKSITISCVGVTGGVLVAATNGITINAAATDKVVIDGLDIEGLSGIGGSLNGIRIIQARDVVVRNTIIRGFQGGTGGNGILVDGTTQIALVVENSTIFNNLIGIRVQSVGVIGSARVYDSLITGNSAAGISVTGALNKAEISGNQIVRTTKALDITGGAVISSYGDNVLSTGGDAPTIIPKG
jgi:hypothetical protein